MNDAFQTLCMLRVYFVPTKHVWVNSYIVYVWVNSNIVYVWVNIYICMGQKLKSNQCMDRQIPTRVHVHQLGEHPEDLLDAGAHTAQAQNETPRHHFTHNIVSSKFMKQKKHQREVQGREEDMMLYTQYHGIYSVMTSTEREEGRAGRKNTHKKKVKKKMREQNAREQKNTNTHMTKQIQPSAPTKMVA